MAIQINLGERLVRLADRVLSSDTNQTIGQTGGITVSTATDTTVPTTKAVKEYVDNHIKVKQLQSGDNIDTLFEQGFYWINSNPDAINVDGTFPITDEKYAYAISVDGGNKVIRQIATVYKGQGTRTFVRMYSGHTSNLGWGEWKEMSFTDHLHGNISSDGKIGTAVNLPIITTTNGTLTTGSFGTGANTFCQGNDSRLSDDRNPISHAVNDTRYGAASSTNYGHIRVMNNLTSTGTTDALSANQGKELKTLVDTKVPITDIKNNLTSTDTNKPLSAKQGQVLKSLVDSKANQNHTHANISDTDWQNVVFESKFKNYASNTNNVRYRRIGKIVHIEGIFTNTANIDVGETAIKVATIPEIYCRPEYIQYGLMQGSGANKFLLSIHPNGNIGISRYGTTSAATTQITYNSSTNLGAWLQCYLTWMVETENISYPTTIIGDYSDAYPNGYTFNVGDPISLPYKLEANGEGIANQTIKLYIDNVEKGTRTTNNNGYVLFENILPWATFSDTNTHNIRVEFEENAPYRSCIFTSSVGGWGNSGGGDPIITG